MTSGVKELRRPVIAMVAAALITTLTAVGVSAQWPTSCVELNDVVETHLGNVDNIGIYQRVFDADAEQACRNDHGDDVRSTFGWAMSTGGHSDAEGATAPSADSVSAQWPTTCVELNDIVEAHLGNVDNIGIYQRAIGDGAEGACRSDHRDDVRLTFRWAFPPEVTPSPQTVRREEAPPTNPWAVISELPWIADGVVGSEFAAVTTWNEIADTNWELARRIAGYHWFVAGTNSDDWVSLEIQALWKLAVIAERFPALVEPLLGYSWMANWLTGYEVGVLKGLTDIAEYDMELAMAAVRFPWIADDIRPIEDSSLSNLAYLAEFAPQLAWLTADLNATAPIADRNIFLPRALARLDSADRWGDQSNGLERVTSKPWFTDGLDAEEVAFLVALPPPGGRRFDELLEQRFTQSSTISLPLTGEVNLWVFQPDPFPAGDELLSMTEQGVRGAEQLMRAPFPITDVIVVVARVLATRDAHSTAVGFDIVRTTKSRERYVAYHELVHLYFDGSFRPLWLNEGAANFVAAYTHDAFGIERLEESRRSSSLYMEQHCAPIGLTNINQLPLLSAPQNRNCVYEMGEHFLISMFELLGEESVSAALRDLYWRHVHFPVADGSEASVRHLEEVAYQVFLEHTPQGLEEQFRDLYKRLHGGPYVDNHR